MSKKDKAIDAAFRKLHIVFRMYAMRFIEDEHLASDIVTDLLYKFLKKGKDLESQEVKKLLYDAIKKKCKSQYRKKKTRKDADKRWWRQNASPVNDPFSIDVTEAEILAKIEHLLEKLPPRQQQAVRGYYLEKISAEDLAEKMGIAVSTVHNLKKMGIDQLRKLLRGQNGLLLLNILLFISENWKK